MVETAEQGNMLVYLRNMLGETLQTHRRIVDGTNSNFAMQLDKIPSGVYFVEIHLNNKMAVKKLVRE
jgi:hypothetical protein